MVYIYKAHTAHKALLGSCALTLLPKVLKSREAAEQLHTEDATLPCNSTRASAARGGPNGYPTTAADGDV